MVLSDRGLLDAIGTKRKAVCCLLKRWPEAAGDDEPAQSNPFRLAATRLSTPPRRSRVTITHEAHKLRRGHRLALSGELDPAAPERDEENHRGGGHHQRDPL